MSEQFKNRHRNRQQRINSSAHNHGDGHEAREQRARATSNNRVSAYLIRHLQVFFFSLGQLCKAPFSSLMTAAVIGIALALPAGFYLLLQNVQQMGGTLDDTAQISLFLQKGVSASGAEHLRTQIAAMPAVSTVDLISPDAALQEFQQYAGFNRALKLLNENPLPSVLVVHPSAAHSVPALVESLMVELSTMKEVDIARLDMQWIRRLNALLDISHRGVLILAILLAASVPLLVGNTIRLAIQSHHAEIVVNKLIGATDAFIRRPYLYSGMLYGLLGGSIAWLLISASFWLLSGPMQRLSLLYDSAFILQGLGFVSSLQLLLVAGLLGWLGSWLAVGRHLRAIEPS
ncbi:MAG: cell division protein FtsX [Gammaproteobacteria bacterium]|nr:cell division protein FtsX [Gammaproteobacteria bacterium]